MPNNRVVFSFFRYPASHALHAFLLMGFQGLFRGDDLPDDTMRLMGCGGGDGFSIVPNFNRYCLMSNLTHRQDLPRVRQSKFYRRVADPSVEQIHFVLQPVSGHGTWGGAPPFDYSNRLSGNRPLAVLTHARITAARAAAFWRGVPGIRRELAASPGCVFHMGFGEQPLRTLATFSVWQDLETMQRFAYRGTSHHRVSRAARAEHWLVESLFVRLEIETIEGDLDHHPQLLSLVQTGALRPSHEINSASVVSQSLPASVR
jgi:hypothetical protein